RWGVTPSAMLGHSVGELVAAAVAGMLPLSSVAAMVAARGRAMAAAPPGAMAAVGAGTAELGELPAGVTVAAENGPHQTVVAGAEEDLSGFLSALAARGVAAARLRTAHAFHSPSMSASARAFAAEVPHLTASPATVPVISAATARPLTGGAAGPGGVRGAQRCPPCRLGAAGACGAGTGTRRRGHGVQRAALGGPAGPATARGYRSGARGVARSRPAPAGPADRLAPGAVPAAGGYADRAAAGRRAVLRRGGRVRRPPRPGRGPGPGAADDRGPGRVGPSTGTRVRHRAGAP